MLPSVCSAVLWFCDVSRQASRLIVLELCCLVASCAFAVIVSQGLARPCSMDLFCLSAVLVDALVGWLMDAKDGFPGRDS